jgi:hypothetical protein
MAFTIRFINETRNSKPGQLIVITSLENQFQYIADWYGASGLFTPLELNTFLPRTKQPAILLTVIRQNELFLFTGFLRHAGVMYSGQAGDYHFYSLYVPGNRR